MGAAAAAAAFGPLLHRLLGQPALEVGPFELVLCMFAVFFLLLFVLLGKVYRHSSVNFDTRQAASGDARPV